MKKKFSPYFVSGVLILIVYLLIENLVYTIPAILAVPVLLTALGLIIFDGIKRRANKEV